ncbi:hypothetical protein NIES2101_42320 [Calothrix sp. HK-06]|nr:hypothetical protein NIES2101_42320 [Calothrix sp. HK-06]
MYQQHNLREREVEIFVSKLLKYGVMIATGIVLFGGISYLSHHFRETPNDQIFRSEPPTFRNPEIITISALSGRPRGIIQLGILLLIATPVARVGFSLLAFIRQRDYLYVIITLIVFSGLIYSLIWSHS